ncbi:MAG: SRPBCC domain-containing protein [Planctomycetota bacterium]
MNAYRVHVVMWAVLVAVCGAVRGDSPATKTKSAERVIKKEVIVDAPRERVWKAWTTEEGIESFFSPGCKIEMKLGGAYELYMGMEKPDESGRRGSEGCKLLSYIPMEMVSFEWNFPPKVMSLRKENAKTHVVLRFDDVGKGKTRVRFVQAGWKEGTDWDEGYAYFDKAWGMVLGQLKDKIKGDGDTETTETHKPDKTWNDGHVTVHSYSKPERRQDFEMTIPVPVAKVWEALATSKGLKRLGGKTPEVELAPGGKYAFWPGAPNKVLSYVPMEMLSTSGSAPPQFPNVRKGGTWSAYYLEKIDSKTTKLRLNCVGWKTGDQEWDDAFKYFLKNNPIFLNDVYDKLTSTVSTERGKGYMRQEGVVDAPVTDVWKAMTTQEGMESWMVAHAEIDLRVGGRMLTHYDKEGVIGDPSTIENIVQSFEPERMFSIKVGKPPEKFPFKEAIKHSWSVIRFEPMNERQTRLTVTGMGYGDDDESQKMLEFFEYGNEWTIRKIQEKFAAPEARATTTASPETVESYAAHLAAAEASFRLNELAEARRWILSAPEPMRNWEWKHLNALLDDSLMSIDAHKDGIMSVAISPDGTLIASGGNDNLVKLWDAATGKEVATLQGHTAPIFTVTFSPDGDLIASSSQDKTVRVWVTKSGELLATYKGHKNPVPCVAFSPDGSKLASCSYELHSTSPSVVIEGQVHLWDASTPGEPKTARRLRNGGVKPISSIAWSPDGNTMYAGTWDSLVFAWDLTSEESGEPRSVKIPEEGLYSAIDALCLSPDGQYIVAGSKDRTARVWMAATFEPVVTLRGHIDYVNGVRFSPDGMRLATAGGDECIRVWDVATWKEISALRGHSLDVRTVCWTPKGDRLISSALDGTVRMWDASFAHYGGIKMTQSAACYAALFSPDGMRLHTCGHDGTISMWDTATGEQLAHWDAHGGKSANTLSLSADGTRLLSCSYDKYLRIWDTATQKEMKSLKNESGVYHAALSGDGKMAVCAQGKTVAVWDVETESIKFKLDGSEGKVQSVAISPDGEMIAASCADKTVRTWDAATGKPIAVMKGHEGNIESAVFSPDGTKIASGSADGTARLWDARSGEEIRVLLRSDDNVCRVAFSPDGSRVATGGNRCMILDVEHGVSVAALRPNADGVWHLSFSKDGTRLATASTDKSIRILDTRPLRELISSSGH